MNKRKQVNNTHGVSINIGFNTEFLGDPPLVFIRVEGNNLTHKPDDVPVTKDEFLVG